jgi:TonB family protein
MSAEMTAAGPRTGTSPSSSNLMDEGLSVLVGAAFTLLLFITMARLERGGQAAPTPVLEEIREVSLPLDVPPPPVAESEPQPDVATITGIEVAAEESPVRISVTVPILEAIPVPLAPPARIQTSVVYKDLRPRMDLSNDTQHVYQQSEVDQRPVVLVRSTPLIPSPVRKNAQALRVRLVFIVDKDGTAGKMRILKSSGNGAFDDIIARCVHDEWVFSPAVKKGRKVKCMVEQAFNVIWNSSPFDS